MSNTYRSRKRYTAVQFDGTLQSAMEVIRAHVDTRFIVRVNVLGEVDLTLVDSYNIPVNKTDFVIREGNSVIVYDSNEFYSAYESLDVASSGCSEGMTAPDTTQQAW